jgi:hypothetical protein
MKDKKKKYSMGGVADIAGQVPGLVQAFSGKSAAGKASAVGGAIGAASNLLVPGLGSVLSPLLSGLGSMIGQKDDESYALNQHFNQVNTSTNPYQLEHGGVIGDDDNFQYKGNSHSQGGIDVDSFGMPTSSSNVEVEGEESAADVIVNGKKIKYVFSNKLKI